MCIEQSEPWPIYFSQVVPWPEDFHYEGDDWQDAIKSSPQLQFKRYSLESGEAVVFSGSSQWHYREALQPSPDKNPFCKLLFFHFIPEGMDQFIRPKTWAQFFGIPELGVLSVPAGKKE